VYVHTPVCCNGMQRDWWVVRIGLPYTEEEEEEEEKRDKNNQNFIT